MLSALYSYPPHLAVRAIASRIARAQVFDVGDVPHGLVDGSVAVLKEVVARVRRHRYRDGHEDQGKHPGSHATGTLEVSAAAAAAAPR